MTTMKASIFLALFAFFCSESEAINCNSGLNSSMTSVSGCMSCQTSAIFQASQTSLVVRACLSGSCSSTDNVVGGNGVKVLCCSTDNCNNQAVTVNTAVSSSGTNLIPSGGSGTYRCYNANMTISTGCTYCMKSITNLVVTSSVTRSCVSVCVPVTTQIYNTQCCQADLCNHAAIKSLPASLFITLLVVLGKFITV